MEANTDKQKTPDTGRPVSAPAPQKSSPKEEGLDFSKQQIAVASAKDRKTREHALALAVVIVLFIVIGLAVAGFLCIKPEPDRIQGQCDATEVRISGKLPGRVATIYVQEGQAVHAGDTLVRIHSSVADARLAQAQAAEDAASATNARVDAGARPQVIESAEQVYNQAVAATGIAKKTFDRMNTLAGEGVVSQQKRDEAEAAYKAAQAGEQAAKAQWDLAKAGAQKEEKAASAAMVRVAKGGVREVGALLQDQILVAPCDGIVTVIYPQESELVAIRAPIMTIEKDDHYAVFNLRETMLKDIKDGTVLHTYIPALDKEVDMEVYYIRDMGSYANWQATKATGDFDARTFTVKARPKRPVQDLRPGMSILLKQ